MVWVDSGHIIFGGYPGGDDKGSDQTSIKTKGASDHCLVGGGFCAGAYFPGPSRLFLVLTGSCGIIKKND